MLARIYLDHAATTPVAEVVLDEMLPYFREHPGNAHSRSHAAGWTAAAAVATARERVANLLACPPEALTFTSGATEAITLAIRGIATRYRSRGRHIVTSAVEHAAVSSACFQLESEGFTVTYLPVDSNGMLSPEALADALQDDTTLFAVLWGNNETGVVQDIEALSAVCRAKEVAVFADGTQVCGKIECHPEAVGIDALACSAHKFYGPKGVGALYLRPGRFPTGIAPLWSGGGQEGGMRGGTLNVPAIVGMGAAAVLAKAELTEVGQRLQTLRDAFEMELRDRLPEVLVNGSGAPRLPHISNVSLRFTEAEAFLTHIQRRLAVSTGSACSSADLEPSHVLLAMGLDREDARAAIRVSLGRDTSAEEMAVAVELISEGVKALRAESPAWELYCDVGS